MKKIVYSAPEMEVLEMKYNYIICASDGSSSIPGLDDEYSDDDPS